MGRAADHPEWILQPYDLLELFPMLEKLRGALQGSRRAAVAGQQRRLLRSATRRRCAATCRAVITSAAAPACGASASRPTARSKAARRWRPRRGAAATSAIARLVDIWERAAPMRFNRGRTVESLWGYCKSCYYADVCKAGCTWTSRGAARQAGQQPDVPSPRARDAARRQARAPRADRARAGRCRSIRAGSS